MSDDHLERTIWQLAHAELCKSPRYVEEIQKRGRWRWRDWLSAAFMIAIAPVVLGFGIAMLAVFFPAILVLPVHAAMVSTYMPHAEFVPSIAHLPAILLGGTALSVAVIVAVLCSKQFDTFCPSEALFRATFYPVPDKVLSERWHSWERRFWVVYLAYIFLLASISTALVVKPGALQLVAMGVAIPLTVGHVGVLAVIAASVTRTTRATKPAWLVPVLLSVTGMVGLLSIGVWPASLQNVTGNVLMALPSGWVNGAVYHLAFEPGSVGVLYLALLAASWTYAGWWLRRGIGIREVFLLLDGLTPVFEWGLRNPRHIDALYEPATPTEEQDIEPAPALADLQQQVAALLSNSWGRRGWVERLIGLALSPRERTILEQVFRAWGVRWTVAWYGSLAVTFAVVILIGAIEIWNGEASPFGSEPGREMSAAALAVLLLMPLTLLAELFAHLLPRGSTTAISRYAGTHPVHPIGWRELRWAVRKAIWLRLVLLLPLGLLCSLLDLLHDPASLPQSFFASISVLICLGVMLETYAMLNPNLGSIPPTSLWDWRILRSLPLIPLGSISLAGVVLTAIAHGAGMPLLAFPGWTLICAGGLAMQEYTRWVYHHTQLDFQCSESLILPRPRRGM